MRFESFKEIPPSKVLLQLACLFSILFSLPHVLQIWLYLFLSILDLLRFDGKIGLALALGGLCLKVDDHLLDLHRMRVLVQDRFNWERFDVGTFDGVEYACIAGLEAERKVGYQWVGASVLVSKREGAISEFG